MRLQSGDGPIRIGTRGSPLALAQANLVRDLLIATHDLDPHSVGIIVISTSGDRIKDRPLSEVGGKGLFTKELEDALFAGEIDLAVHSSKDVATVLPDGLILPVFLKREDVRDAFISLHWPNLEALPEGAKFGTSSIRRAAQMLRHRPDLVIVPFRGNVDTRLAKLEAGIADATLLAAAGLNRLGKAERIASYLDPELFPPAPAQGAVSIEIRQNDSRLMALVSPLDHAPTAIAVRAERAMLKALDGSCRTPIAAFTRLEHDTVTLLGEILSMDGQTVYRTTLTGAAADADVIGAALGEQLLAMAGPQFLAAFT